MLLIDRYAGVDDYDVIRECLLGDQDAFEEILGRYKNLVYSIVLRMVNCPEDANDLAQEVFIKIYKNLDKYQPEFKFATWLIRITTNHVIDFRRKKKPDTVSIDALSDRKSDETPEGDYLNKERMGVVVSALNKLPEMYKIPIILYHQYGLSYNEIATVINEPLSKVKNRIFRGRKMLKEFVTKPKEGVAYEM